MRKLITICLFLLLISIVFAGEETLKGKGTLSAQGNGVVRIKGAGQIEISGDGVLWIVDCSPDEDLQIQISGSGHKSENMPSYVNLYKGFDGHASISGSALKLLFTGKDITLNASGKGRVFLKGVGTFQKGNQIGIWSEQGEGTIIEVHESE